MGTTWDSSGIHAEAGSGFRLSRHLKLGYFADITW